MLIDKVVQIKDSGIFSDDVVKALELAINQGINNIDDLERFLALELSTNHNLSKPEIIAIIIDLISKL